MRWFLVAALALGLGAVGAPERAEAGENLIVVELFTSQGCSSCPPADALLADLAEVDGVLPLALHVDYWDYIGWKDSFASPVFTRRQKAYARAFGARSVYTPQMIVGGTDVIVGSKPVKLMAALEAHAGQGVPARVTLARRGDRVEVTVVPVRPLSGGHVVMLVRYLPERTVEITRGENAGRRIRYRNIVQELTELGRWNGRGTFSGSAPVRGAGEYAAFVQNGHGPILAAARLD